MKQADRTRRHMWVEFVVGSRPNNLREVSLLVLRFSPLLKTQHVNRISCHEEISAIRSLSFTKNCFTLQRQVVENALMTSVWNVQSL